jgi:hypothetical protein
VALNCCRRRVVLAMTTTLRTPASKLEREEVSSWDGLAHFRLGMK